MEWRGERHWESARSLNAYIRNAESATPNDHAALIKKVHLAVGIAPGNVKYRYHLSLYQWRALELVIAAQAAQGNLPGDWNERIDLILDNLMRIRGQCPTYANAVFLEGIIRRARGQGDRGRLLVEQAFKLDSHDARICLAAGTVAALENKLDLSLVRLKRAVELDPKMYPAVSALYLELKRPDLATELAGNDYRRLLVLAGGMSKNPSYAQQAQEAKQRGVKLLEDHCKTGKASANDLARLASAKAAAGDLAAAADYYRLAIDIQYDQLAWRIARANVLIALGKSEEAAKELRKCLRRSPNHKKAKKMMNDLMQAGVNVTGIKRP